MESVHLGARETFGSTCTSPWPTPVLVQHRHRREYDQPPVLPPLPLFIVFTECQGSTSASGLRSDCPNVIHFHSDRVKSQPHFTWKSPSQRRNDKMASTSKSKKTAARGLSALEITIHKKALSCPKQVCHSHRAQMLSPGSHQLDSQTCILINFIY